MVCGLALAVTGLGDMVTPAYAVTATGGTITTYTVGGITYNVHTFTSSGTLHVTAGGTVRYLVVGGGGGGGGGTSTNVYGAGGGGGAGGFLGGGPTDTMSVSAIDYTVTVGGGGSAGATGTAGSNGQNSVFGSNTAVGGGGGAGAASGTSGTAAATGGSGGGGSQQVHNTGGSGTGGQGNSGGNSSSSSPGYAAGGGGGAGAVGVNGGANSGNYGGNGGAGLSSNITGATTWYAGGGGGATYNNANGQSGSGWLYSGLGGLGGGGKGGVNAAGYTLAGSGTANTGGGGGGGSRANSAGAGGSGVVIIAYALASSNYTLTYTAGANGSISGTSPQTVASGDSGTAVNADPATGYHFVNWSDASTANPRTDTSVGGDITVTANFAINSIAYNTWALAHAGGGSADGDSNNDGVNNGIAFFMNATGLTTNPALDAATRTVTWTNGGNIPSSDYGNQFVVQTSDDLAAWTDVLLSDTTHLSNTSGAVSYTFTGTDPRFVRLKVAPNPN